MSVGVSVCGAVGANVIAGAGVVSGVITAAVAFAGEGAGTGAGAGVGVGAGAGAGDGTGDGVGGCDAVGARTDIGSLDCDVSFIGSGVAEDGGSVRGPRLLIGWSAIGVIV